MYVYMFTFVLTVALWRIPPLSLPDIVENDYPGEEWWK